MKQKKEYKEQPEYALQKQFVAWMRLQYPKVVVFSDTAAHIKKTKLQQIRANGLQSGWKQPDVFVAQPSGNFSGLWLELKAETPYRKDGKLKSGNHLKSQRESMQKLMESGYAAQFAWDFDQLKAVVFGYLNDETKHKHYDFSPK